MLSDFYRRTFNIGDKHYLVNKLTSSTDMRLDKIVYSPFDKYVILSWNKVFNFSGDVLKIEQKFSFNKNIPDENKKPTFFIKSPLKENPIYTFFENMLSFEDYMKEYGQDKKWMDYCEYIAIGTESLEQFNYVKNTSQKLIDAYKKAIQDLI